jgi:hypothetical protein
MVVERGNCRGQRQIVDIERLTHTVHQIGDLSRSQRIANTQTSQSKNLGERAGHHQIRKILDPAAVSTRSAGGRYSL